MEIKHPHLGVREDARDNYAGFELLPLHLSFLDSISSVWTSGSIRYKIQMADKNSNTNFVNRVSDDK